MASWLKTDRKWAFRSGALLAGWVLGTTIPNTYGAGLFDWFCQKTHVFYKDAQSQRESRQLIQEVFADLESHRGYPVNKENIHFHLTTNIYPRQLFHKGCSQVAPAHVVLPIGMRQNAMEVFYLHCNFDRNERLDAMSCFNREEQKFLYTLTTLYTEDCYALYSSAMGAGIYLAACVPYLMMEQKIQGMKQELTKSAETVAQKNVIFQRFANRARFMSAVLLFAAGLGTYLLMTRTLSLKMEKDAHETIANMGKDYAKGAVGYYYKVKAYHKFFGGKGMDLFTEGGDEVNDILAFFPTKMTYSEKLDIFTPKLTEEEFMESIDMITHANKLRDKVSQNK